MEFSYLDADLAYTVYFVYLSIDKLNSARYLASIKKHVFVCKKRLLVVAAEIAVWVIL